MFRLYGVVDGFFDLEVVVREHTDYDLTEHEASAKAEVSEAGFASVEGVLILKNGCEGCEEEIEVAVDNGHVDSEDENDRGAEKHFRGMDNGGGEQLLGGLAFVILGPEI